MECLLPSEIARLVFGYLEEQKCDEAAQTFLEHSPYLSECLNVVKAGRKFSSRVQGCSLLDVLDEYCAVQNLVAERIRKLPESSSEQVRNCGGLVEKLKILLDNSKSGQTVAVSISVLPHSGTTQGSSTQGAVHNRSRAVLNPHERKRSIRFQGQENKHKVREKDDRNVSVECSVETTPLETLPGLSSQDSRTTKSVHSASKTVDSEPQTSENVTTRINCEELSHLNVGSEQFYNEKSRSHSFSSTSTVPDKDATQEINVNICEVETSTNASPKRKSKKKCPSLKTSPLRVRKALRDNAVDDDEEEEESVAITLHRALLNNTELHEKIAENINSVIRIPNDLTCGELLSAPEGSEEGEGVIQELNNAIKMVVDKTQEDPVFERLLEEIIGPAEEDMSSSPTAVESETDDACEASEAVVCNEKQVISKDAVADNQLETVVSSVPDQPLAESIDEKEQNSINLVGTSIIESPVTGVPNCHIDKTPANLCVELPVASGDEIEDNCSEAETLANSSKTSKNLGEKLTKKHSVGQTNKNQGKGKLSSVNNNDATQDGDGCGRKSIPKKEVRDLLENLAPDTVRTPKNDIPLKQRLRSARRSDSNLQGSTKECSSVDRSLEDQNAKAIQLILEANKKSALENASSNDDKTDEANHISVPTSTKKTSDVPESSARSSNVDEIVGKTSKNVSAETTNVICEKETTERINPAAELNNELVLDNFNNRPIVDPVVCQPHSSKVEHLNIEKQEIMMLTIPNVVNTSTSNSSVVSQSQSQQMVLQSTSQYAQQSVYLPKQDILPREQTTEHLNSQLSIMTLSQSSGDSGTGSSKQLIIDETNSSAVIVCDSDMAFPPVFNQYVKGSDIKGNQSKKLRSLAPRPIRPKPSTTTSFPLHLFTSDMTPQYILTQVSSDPAFEASNIITPSSSGLLNIVNLTLPVLSQTTEPSKKICVCTAEDCGKNCLEISENNINFLISTGEANSESCGDSELSNLSEHRPDRAENSDASEKDKMKDKEHNNRTIVPEENSVCAESSTSNLNELALPHTTSATVKHQDEIFDMSSLLVLPEQMPKPRETPQAFVAGKSGSNSRRLSLSTPRRRTSHIRTLDFGTPLKSGTESIALKKSQTSPKPILKSNVETGSKSKVEFFISPYKSLSNQVRNVRSSLFTSPDPPINNKDEKKSKENSDSSQIIPIATRSPVTHLLGDWDKATGVGLIFNGVSPENLDPKNTEPRPSRITPKTLLFSPESEGGSGSDQNHTPPANQDTSSPRNVVQSVKQSENGCNLFVQDKNIKGNEPITPSPKGSPNTMPIKQKLKSRSWDADLRKLLDQDFENVYVQDAPAKDVNEIMDENISPSKKADKISEDVQSPKKLKKRERKKNLGSYDNASNDGTKELTNVITGNSKKINVTATLERENEFASIDGNTAESNEINKENTTSLRSTIQNAVIEMPRMCSKMSSDNQVNFASKKRKACVEIPEVSSDKRSKSTDEEEEEVGKSVEEVLQTMFCGEEEVNVDVQTSCTKQNSSVDLNKTTLNKNVSDVINELSTTPRHVMDSVEASSQTGNSSNKSIFDLEVEKDNENDKLEPIALKESCNSDTNNYKNKEQAFGNDFLTDMSNFSGKCSTETPELAKCSGKSSEDAEKSYSFPTCKETEPNLEKNVNLETPIKDVMKYLGKNFNPMTPGPIDNLFPMTPRVLSPSRQEDTPITKLLRSEPCINFSMIVTPSLPPTPNIMISPSSESGESPTSYASRPTDYSSCSSYYNPSKSIDTPSKLEQELIKECSKIEQNKKESSSKAGTIESKGKTDILTKIVSSEELHPNKNSDTQNTISTKDYQVKDTVPISRDNIKTKNPGSSSDVSVMDERSSESCETAVEKLIPNIIAVEENISSRKISQESKKLADFASVPSDPEHQIITFVIKKNLNSATSPSESMSDKSSKESKEKIEELSSQLDRKVPSNSDKTKEKDPKEMQRIEVSSMQLNTEEVEDEKVEGKNIQIKPSNLQVLVEKRSQKVIKEMVAMTDCSASQDKDKIQLHQEKEVMAETVAIVKGNTECVSVLCASSLKENAASENQSKKCKTISDKKSMIISTKTQKVKLNQSNSNNDSVESSCKDNDNKDTEKHSQRKREACSKVKKSNTRSAGEGHSTKKSHILRDFTKKKDNLSDTITRSPKKLPTTDSSSLCLFEGVKTKTTGNDNIANQTIEKTRETIPNIQAEKRSENSDQTKGKEHEGTVGSVGRKPSRKKLIETPKSQKNDPRRKMIEEKLQKDVSSQKLPKKQTKEVDSSSTKQLSPKIIQSKIANQKEKVNEKNVSKRGKETPRVEKSRQRFKRTPQMKEIVCIRVSRKSNKLTKAQLSKVKSIEIKDSGVQNIEYSDKLLDNNKDERLNKENESCENKCVKMRAESEITIMEKGRTNVQKFMLEGKKKKDKDKMNEGEDLNDSHKIINQKSEGENCNLSNEREVSKNNKEKVQNEENGKNQDSTGKKLDQLQNEKAVLNVSVQQREMKNESDHAASHKSEEISIKVVTEMSHREENVERGQREKQVIEVGLIENSSLEKQRKIIPSSSDSLQENVQSTSPSEEVTTEDNLHMNNNDTNDISFKQMDLCTAVEVCERETDKESSSSESDSDESSGDSDSESSDDSSNDSAHSRVSSIGDTDSALNEAATRKDDSSVKFSSDKLKSGENGEKEDNAHFFKDQSGSKTINEILKTVSPVSYVCKDKCFSSELDEKKRRTIARLKGTEETLPTVKNLSNIEMKDDKGEHFPTFLQRRKIVCERSLDGEKNWEESSVEEFPILHLSDSESTGNPTPHVSPTKTPFITSVLEKCIFKKRDKAPYGEDGKKGDLKINDQEQENVAEKQGHADDCIEKRTEDSKEGQAHLNQAETVDNVDHSKVNSSESNNLSTQADNLEHLGDSTVVNILRLNEHELYLTLRYEGNLCPSPKIVNQSDFCYSLAEDDDDITITGSSFQNLMEIFPKEVGDKPSCTNEQEQETTFNRAVSNTKRKNYEQELCDSNSDSTSIFEECDKQGQRTAKLRPLDLLYEEMMKSNDSSSFSDEADKLIKKRGKLLASTKFEKKKSSLSGKSHQKLSKTSELNQSTSQENMRYHSPLEMIPEYNSQKEDRNSKSYHKAELRSRFESKNSEINISERKVRSEELEEGEILDSPVKESSSSGAKTRRVEASKHINRSGSRRSESSDGSVHSYSSRRSKPRSSDVMKRETSSQHQKTEKHQSSAASSHLDDVRSLPPKKRKAVSEDTKEPEKRARHDNPCKLLKNLNIESFLNKVHGEDTSK